MLRIRLRRMGTTNAPFYRVVVSDSRKVPTSKALEEIGVYDPTRSPSIIQINQERVEHWVGNGARMSSTVQSLIKRGNQGELTQKKAELAPGKAKPAPAPAEEPAVEAAAPEAEAASEASEEAATEAAPEAAAEEAPAEEAPADDAPSEDAAAPEDADA